MKRDKLYISHILKAIEDIEAYTDGMDFENFSKDKLVQDGVMRKLEIIGEASKRLSSNVKDLAKDIPWKEICGMRDKLIHDYFGVSLMAVWKTATEDTKILKEALEKSVNSN